jgi:hypothetical protein
MYQSSLHPTFRWLPFALFLLCAAFAFAAAFFRALSGTPFVPKPGDSIDIRANRIAILRLPTEPIQEVAVYGDGEVTRYAYPIEPNRYAKFRLSADEQRDFEQLRMHWCTTDLPSFALRPNTAFYDLAFRCVGYQVKQAKVPIEMLPPFFMHILQRLPDSNL